MYYAHCSQRVVVVMLYWVVLYIRVGVVFALLCACKTLLFYQCIETQSFCVFAKKCLQISVEKMPWPVEDFVEIYEPETNVSLVNCQTMRSDLSLHRLERFRLSLSFAAFWCVATCTKQSPPVTSPLSPAWMTVF